MSIILSAAASRVITPKGSVMLGASHDHNEPWSGTESQLEANVLALWDTRDEFPLLFVTLDLLYPGRIIRAAIEDAAHPIPPERIVVAASHTHRGPMTDDTKAGLGLVDDCYISWLENELSSLVRSVLDSERVPVALSVGAEVADHSINRRLRKRFMLGRRPRFNEVVNAPNPSGTKDELLTAIVIRDERDGRPLALVWNYACHPVAGPTLNAISGHFPTDVRELVREETEDPSLPVLYFQGFSGNTRPSASAGAHSLDYRFRQLVSGPLFERMTVKSYKDWVLSLANVLFEAASASKPLQTPEFTTRRISLPSTSFVFSEHPLEDVTIARVDLNDEVTLILVSGEVVAEYSAMVRRMLPHRKVLCVGCTDHVVGYIPTQEILREGGYEAKGFLAPFGLKSLNPDVQTSFVSAIEKLS